MAEQITIISTQVKKILKTGRKVYTIVFHKGDNQILTGETMSTKIGEAPANTTLPATVTAGKYGLDIKYEPPHGSFGGGGKSDGGGKSPEENLSICMQVAFKGGIELACADKLDLKHLAAFIKKYGVLMAPEQLAPAAAPAPRPPITTEEANNTFHPDDGFAPANENGDDIIPF